MRLLWKDILRIGFLMVMGLMLNVCSASPDESSPGNCTLSCSGTKLAANNFRIRFLAGNSIAAACHGIANGQNYPGVIPVQFVIEQNNPPPLPAGAIPGNTPGSTEPGSTVLVSDVGTGVPALAFEPVIVGGFGGPNNPDSNDARYKGIQTSQSEWCTDSCGVGVVELVPECFGDNPNVITLQIHSGAATGTSTITVNP